MRFFGSGVGHKSTRAATDHFLDDRDYSGLDIDRQHDSDDDLMDWEDEVDDSPVAEGSMLQVDGDDDYGYGDLLDELEDIMVASVDLEDDCSSGEDGTLVGGS